MAALSDIKGCLKAIEDGQLNRIDIATFTKKFQDDPLKLGDHLQYALHKFCKQNENNEMNNIVVKLSHLCFSKESTSGFYNMDRFLGSLFHISSYFLKQEMYVAALEIIKSVEYKRIEIEAAALNNQSTRNFLYLLHSHFITKAQEIAAKIKDITNNEDIEISTKLAEVSVKFLHLIKKKQLELGRKIFRNLTVFLNNLKFHKKDMAEFYQNIEIALTNIMPLYRNNDVLAYYVIKIDQIDRLPNMEMKDFNSYFKRHIHLIALLLNDLKIIKSWDLILDFFFGSFKQDEHFKCVTNAVERIASVKNCAFHLLILSIVFNHANHLWMNIYADNWSEVISSKFVQFLFNTVLLTVRRCVGNVSQYCRLDDYKVDICFCDFFSMNLQRILHMIRFCLKYNDMMESLDLMKIAREAFRMSKQAISEMTKQCCLARKKVCWHNTVIRYTNIIESLIRPSNSNNAWLYMRDCSEELVCDIINSEFDPPYEWKRVSILFQRWHYATLKLKQYDEALFVSVFYIISFPKDKEEALSMWIQTKTICCESSRSLTFKDIIDKEEERIKRMNPKCELNGQDIRRLLMMELLAYSSCSPDVKNSPSINNLILNLWDLLKKLHLEIMDRAGGLNHVIASTISSVDSISLSEFKQDCHDVLNEIQKRERKNCRSLIYSGNLKYCLFLIQLRAVQDSEDKMNTSNVVLEYLKKEEEEKAKFGELVDLNLTCNIMPSSNHFTVKCEENYLKALNETVELWKEASEVIEIQNLEPHELDAWLHNLKQISEMYYLIGDVYQSFVSWLLYYKISKMCKNNYCTLLGISQLILGCANIENLELVAEGDEIVRELEHNNKDKDAIVIYLLAVAYKHLKNKNSTKCLIYLTKIKEIIGSLKSSTRSHLFYARYWCLVSKFLCLHHDHMEKFGLKPNTEIRTVVFQAFSYANAATKDGTVSSFGPSECCEVLLTMLEVNTWSARFFGVYYQAAFMRFFLDDLYQIFQKLVLPTRTASILALLAEVDIMCEKIEDGSIKLNSLKNILETSSSFCLEEECMEKKKSDFLQVPITARDEGDSSRSPSPARFLTCRDNARECELSPLRYAITEGSSVKRRTHAEKCKCYPCRNLTIRTLVFSALLLEAQLQKIKGYMKTSYLFYREGYDYLKKLESHESELNVELAGKLSNLLENFDSGVDLQADFVKINSVKFLTSYAFFMLSQSSKEDVHKHVTKLIERIDRTMKSFSFEEKMLQWSVMELKLISFAMYKRRNAEMYQKKVDPSAVTTAPKETTIRTPLVPKVRVKNVVPLKQKQTKNVKTPNLFVSKPGGRRVFDDDAQDNSETCDKQNIASKTSTVSTKDTEKNKPLRKRNLRKNQPKEAEIESVELLS